MNIKDFLLCLIIIIITIIIIDRFIAKLIIMKIGNNKYIKFIANKNSYILSVLVFFIYCLIVVIFLNDYLNRYKFIVTFVGSLFSGVILQINEIKRDE